MVVVVANVASFPASDTRRPRHVPAPPLDHPFPIGRHVELEVAGQGDLAGTWSEDAGAEGVRRRRRWDRDQGHPDQRYQSRSTHERPPANSNGRAGRIHRYLLDHGTTRALYKQRSASDAVIPAPRARSASRVDSSRRRSAPDGTKSLPTVANRRPSPSVVGRLYSLDVFAFGDHGVSAIGQAHVVSAAGPELVGAEVPFEVVVAVAAVQ